MTRKTLGVGLALTACLSASGWAAIIHVPAEYGTIQAAIDAASSGDEVLIADGVYPITATINVNKAITLSGTTEAGTILTPNTGHQAYGIYVNVGGATLEDFTIQRATTAPATRSGYMIHASGTPNVQTGITVRNVTIEGSGSIVQHRAGLDIHGYDNVTLSHVTSKDATYGNGIQLTGCANVDVDNAVTANNAWGSLAIYCSQYLVPTRACSDVVVDGTSCSFAENNVFIENGYSLLSTDIHVTGYEYQLTNSMYRAGATNYIHFQADLAAAQAFAALAFSSYPTYTVFTNLVNNTLEVYDGMSIQTAINAADPGDEIVVGIGVYEEMLTITKSLNLHGEVGESPSTFVQAPATLPVASDPLSNIVLVSGAGVAVEISHLTIQGGGPTGCGSIGRGIFVRDGAYANIHDNRIMDIRDTPFSGCQNGNAIQVGRMAWGTTGTATITNNLIQGYQKTGIIVDNAGSNASINENSIVGVGTTPIIAQNGVQISRGATATMSSNSISGNSYHLEGSTWDWGSAGLLLYQSGAVAMTGGNGIYDNDNIIYAYGGATGALTVGAEAFGMPLGSGFLFVNGESYSVDLSACMFGLLDPNTATQAELFELQDVIYDRMDDPAAGLVLVKAGHLFVSEGGTIQSAIDAATAGDVVNVEAGTYAEDLTIAKTLTLAGAGASSTILSGPMGGAGTTAHITASDVELFGFTVTRAGNNPTDWNGALNTGGVSIQGACTGVFLHDNIFTGNRTGVDINNSSEHTLQNNVITNNRTGLIFRNQTDNMVLTDNAITDNWTVGIVFLDASSGSNAPVQTALGWTCSGNNISGNWYGQIVDRQTGGSLPLPGDNPKNFMGNYLGAAVPVVSNLNSTEPAYSAQIPVIFGGTATAPGGQPDILGTASANILYSPVLAGCQVTHTLDRNLISVDDDGAHVDNATWSFAYDATLPGAEGWRALVIDLAWDGTLVTPSAPAFTFTHADGAVADYELLDANSMQVTLAITGSTQGQLTDCNLFTLTLDGIAQGVSSLAITNLQVLDVQNPPVMLSATYGAPLSVTVDGTGPTTQASYPTATCINADFSVGLSVTDNYALHSVDYRFDGGSWVSVASGLPGTSYTSTFTAPIGDLGEGDHSIEFRATDDVANVGDTSASWAFHVDRLDPVAASGMDAQPMHNGCAIFWSAGSEMDGYTLYYKKRDGYPYPTRSTAWDGNLANADGSYSVLAAATTFTFTTDNSYGARGIYDFILVSEDCVNDEAVSGMASATNYFLGDVAGTPSYDGVVYMPDLSVMAASYGSTPTTDPGREMNVGPTTDGSSYGLPYGTTARVNFEDLIIFAINYGPAGPELPVSSGMAADEAVVRLERADDGFALVLDGQLKGYSARLVTEAALMEALSDDAVFFYRDGNAWMVDVVSLQGSLSDGSRVALRFAGEGVPSLTTVDGRDAFNNSQTVSVLSLESTLPTSYALEQNFPNPFNPTTTIRFALPEAASVRLALYNAVGQEVMTLVQDVREAGLHEIVLDGSSLASGVYVYRLEAGRFADQKKLVLVK